MLVKEIGKMDVLVIGIEALPKELVALSLGHKIGENWGVALWSGNL